MVITYAEAKEFVEKKLKIERLEEKFSKDKLNLLNELIRAFHEAIPFHNIRLLSLATGKRRQPTEGESNAAILSGRGGLCVVNNTGFKNVLQALGYSVFFAQGSVTLLYDHVVIIAEIEEKEYVVDVGCGFPTFEAIPLDFGEESKLYTHSFVTYRLIRKDDAIIRLHKRSSPTETSTESQDSSNTWKKFYHFKVAPVDISSFDKVLYQIYTVPNTSPFLVSLRAFRCVNGKTIAMRDNFILTEDDNNHLVETEIETVEEVKSKLLQLFPMLSLDLVNVAMDRWEKDIQPTLKEPPKDPSP